MMAVLAMWDGDAAATWVLGWLWQGLVYGTLLAVATWLLTRLMQRRMSASVHAALWCVVLLKFIAPTGPPWSHSLASLCPGIRAAPAALWSPAGAVAPIPALLPAVDSSPIGESAHVNMSSPSLTWRAWLAGAYLTAALSLLGCRAYRYRTFRARCLALSRPNEQTAGLVTNVCRRLGVRRIPTTRISHEPPVPFVMGVFRPVLVLSRRHLARHDELETVIVHEVAHLRRGDLLVRCLQRATEALLFFWPVVAWVNRRIDEAREQACDEWALRHGKLAAGEYARCVLSAALPERASRLVWRPACMARSGSRIERRIDVILKTRMKSDRRSCWRLPTVALLAAWCGFALGGAADGAQEPGAGTQFWPATEEAVQEHAAHVYQLVATHETADLNSDGELAYLEKDTYLVALAMIASHAFMVEFPYADRNHSGSLDILEANDALRAITLIAYADRRPTAPDAQLDYEFCHMALEAQEWLLDSVPAKPSSGELDNIWSVLKRVQPRQETFSARMLDRGGPSPAERNRKCGRAPLGRFQELEGNIADVKAKLAEATDAADIARLGQMLSKLQSILGKLQME